MYKLHSYKLILVSIYTQMLQERHGNGGSVAVLIWLLLTYLRMMSSTSIRYNNML